MKRLARLAPLLVAAVPFAAGAAEIAHATVAVTGGPHAGRHEASTERGGCSTGLTGANSFGVQISNAKDKDGNKLNSVQVDVPDRSKPNEFLVQVGFGPITHRTATYAIDTRRKSGSGSIAIAEQGATASVKFSGTTADGMKLEGTVDCKTILKGR